MGHLNYLAVPRVVMFEFLLVPVTTNHFPWWEKISYIWPHISLGVGILTAFFWKIQIIIPMRCLLPPIRQLYIDRCIIV